MKLSTRLTVAMVGLVVFTAVAVGLLINRNLETVVMPRALERVETHVRLLAAELSTYVRGARADILGFRSAVALNGIVRAHIAGGVDPLDGTTEDAWRQRMAARYVAELTSKPSYMQFRIIGIDDGGREIVRVERSSKDDAIRIVPDSELRQQGNRDYFTVAVQLPPGEIYVSPVELNQEGGVIETPHVPVLRVAAPIHTPDGKPFGIVIINVDMRPIFEQIRSAARPGTEIYVINEQGDYLVHPDRNREFAFELGSQARWQIDFPRFAAAFARDETAARVVTDAAGERSGVAMAWTRLAGGPPAAVVEVMPAAVLMAATAVVRSSSLLAGLAAVLCAGLIAVLLARSLSKPLVQMTAAVEGFGRDQALAVPTSASGEIGMLARAFARMTAEVQEKTAALKREVEEHRRTGAALVRHADRERLFGAAVESSDDAIVTMTLTGIITGWNPGAERLFGFTGVEAIDRNIDIIIPDDRRDELHGILERLRRGDKIDHFETVRRSKDRRPIDVSLRVSPVKSPAGTITGACQIMRDVTEQRLTEQKFRLAVEASPSGIVMIDGSGAIVLVNAETERMFRYRRDELIGRPVDMLVPAGLRERHVQHRAGFVSQPQARRMGAGRDLYGLRKDGSEFPVEIGLNPIRTKGGLLVLSVIVDITESKKARESLQESERMARGIIDTALDAFVQMDEAGKIVEWNPQAEAIFGWPRSEAIGQVLGDLIVPEQHRSRHKDGLARFLRTGQSTLLGTRFEIDALRRDGREVKVELSVTVLRRREGYIFNGFIRDLTDKVAAEEQLRQAQKMEAVGQLTGGVAHDFNNILTVITGTIEILSDAVADQPQLAAIAKMIDEAAERGANLTQHLLAFARKQPLQPRETDVNLLIIEAAKLLQPTLGEHIEIESLFADDVWPALVDRNQLATALLNLALNARDAMPDGGKLIIETRNVHLDEGYASVNADVRPGPYVLVAVSDTGSGIPEAVRDKVFEPFFTTKETGKGTGLGLSMVYGFVKQSGGHIKIYSEEGHGTTIKLYLPRAAELGQQHAEAPSALLEGGHETVLVVEDDDLVRNYVVAQLRSLGYRTSAARNASEALAIVDSDLELDMLFTDVIMPGSMNGRQLADEAARRRPSLKVLFTSGYTENAIIHHGRLDPGVLLLAKPYRKSELARMIRKALASSSSLARSDSLVE